MAIPFQYESEYKRKLCTPDEAARVVKSGDWLDISMGCAFPSLMDAAIAKRKEELYGVKIRGYLIQQPIQMVECDPGQESAEKEEMLKLAEMDKRETGGVRPRPGAFYLQQLAYVRL